MWARKTSHSQAASMRGAAGTTHRGQVAELKNVAEVVKWDPHSAVRDEAVLIDKGCCCCRASLNLTMNWVGEGPGRGRAAELQQCRRGRRRRSTPGGRCRTAQELRHVAAHGPLRVARV